MGSGTRDHSEDVGYRLDLPKRCWLNNLRSRFYTHKTRLIVIRDSQRFLMNKKSSATIAIMSILVLLIALLYLAIPRESTGKSIVQLLLGAIIAVLISLM